MVRNFKGVVKVADVQEEFDNLLNTINSKIDTYNSSLTIEDVDYNNGGSDLAPYGYTLSVGGLKKVLAAYDGAILGANILRTSTNQYIVSEGLYIKDGEVTRLPSKALYGEGDKVYFDEATESYTFDTTGANRLYPDTNNNIIVTPGTYPITVYDENHNATNTTVTFESAQTATKYISNIVTNNMQNSTCKMDIYANYAGQYDYSSLAPSCLIDSSSPQYSDVYLGGLSGYSDASRDYFTSTIPENLDFGNLYIYGIKAEFTITENPSPNQAVYINSKYANVQNFSSLNGWKFQLFAYDQNDNLVKSGDISVGGGYFSYANIIGLNNSIKKIILCAIAPDTYYMFHSLLESLDIRVSNTKKNTYTNLDVDCCLMYDVNRAEYGVEEYIENYNTLLGSAHFMQDTDNLEYITLEGGGGEPVNNILISNINKNRISKLCNRPNATNEEIPDYKVTIESKNSGYTYNGNQYLSNSEKGQFYSGSAGRNCAIKLFDTQVAYHHWGNDRSDSYHEPLNFMFIPKGIQNPYNSLSGETGFAMQKVWNYILERPER